MGEMITFYDEVTSEEIFFEVIDAFDLEGQRYILVADEDDEAIILKEVQMGEEDITYTLIQEDDEFQKVALLFLENESEYDLEI